MVYSSVIFLFYFLPLLLLIYYVLPGIKSRNMFMFLASMLFYMWGEGKLLVLLLAVGASAWGFSCLIVKTKYKILSLYLAILSYVLILLFYKYLGFLIDNLKFMGIGRLSEFWVVLPLGVSFFCFQAISYVTDVYRNHQTYERNIFKVLLYISMFPQLISGPLVRYAVIQTQLESRSFNFNIFSEGVRRFIIGMAKKSLIANPLGLLVADIMGADVTLLTPFAAWVGILTFTLQLYFDFSAYTDMAIGVAKMLGFNLPENFNYPYVSRSITDFWRRWHMSLSAWLRDYIFMPLSLNFRRWRKAGVFFALLITFTICGMWHSAGWNFIIWGAIHGLFLGLEFIFLARYLNRIKDLSVIYMLLVVLTSFVFVRVEGTEEALAYLSAMFKPDFNNILGVDAFITPQHLALIIVGCVLSVPLKLPDFMNKKYFSHLLSYIEIAFLAFIFLLSLMAITGETYNPFLYFKF